MSSYNSSVKSKEPDELRRLAAANTQPVEIFERHMFGNIMIGLTVLVLCAGLYLLWPFKSNTFWFVYVIAPIRLAGFFMQWSRPVMTLTATGLRFGAGESEVSWKHMRRFQTDGFGNFRTTLHIGLQEGFTPDKPADRRVKYKQANDEIRVSLEAFDLDGKDVATLLEEYRLSALTREEMPEEYSAATADDSTAVPAAAAPETPHQDIAVAAPAARIAHIEEPTAKHSFFKRCIPRVTPLRVACLALAAGCCAFWLAHRMEIADYAASFGNRDAALADFFPKVTRLGRIVTFGNWDLTAREFNALCRYGKAADVSGYLRGRPDALGTTMSELERSGAGTPLHHAAVRSLDPAVLQVLVAGGVPIDATDSVGRTALHMAAEFNSDILATAILLANGAKRELADASGKTPLDRLILTGGSMPREVSKAEEDLFGQFKLIQREVVWRGGMPATRKKNRIPLEQVVSNEEAKRYVVLLAKASADAAKSHLELNKMPPEPDAVDSRWFSFSPRPGAGAALAKAALFIPEANIRTLNFLSLLIHGRSTETTSSEARQMVMEILLPVVRDTKGQGYLFELACSWLVPLSAEERAAGVVLMPKRESDNTLLFDLVRFWPKEKVGLLLAAGLDLERNREGKTAVEELIGHGNIETAWDLIQAGASYGSSGSAPDFIVRELLNRGVSGSHLSPAAKKILSLAVEKGASLDVRADTGNRRTLLEEAARSGNLESIRFLVKLGANPNISRPHEKGSGALAAIDWSQQRSDNAAETFTTLVELGADPSGYSVAGPVALGELTVVEMLLKAGGSIEGITLNDVNWKKDSARRIEALLIEKGVTGDQDYTAHAVEGAVSGNNLANVRLWLDERGAKPNFSNGAQPLSYVNFKSWDGFEIASILLRAGADVNRKEPGYASPAEDLADLMKQQPYDERHEAFKKLFDAKGRFSPEAMAETKRVFDNPTAPAPRSYDDFEDLAWLEEVEAYEAYKSSAGAEDKRQRHIYRIFSYVNMALNGNAYAAAMMSTRTGFSGKPGTYYLYDLTGFYGKPDAYDFYDQNDPRWQEKDGWKWYAEQLVAPDWTNIFEQSESGNHPAVLLKADDGYRDKRKKLLTSCRMGYAPAQYRFAKDTLRPSMVPGDRKNELIPSYKYPYEFPPETRETYARDMLRAAASQGDPHALYLLAEEIAGGAGGKAPDVETAVMYYLLSHKMFEEMLYPGMVHLTTRPEYQRSSADKPGPGVRELTGTMKDVAFGGRSTQEYVADLEAVQKERRGTRMHAHESIGELKPSKEVVDKAAQRADEWVGLFLRKREEAMAPTRLKRADIAAAMREACKARYNEMYDAFTREGVPLPPNIYK